MFAESRKKYGAFKYVSMRRDLSYALLYCIVNNKFFEVFPAEIFSSSRMIIVMIIYYGLYGEIGLTKNK